MRSAAALLLLLLIGGPARGQIDSGELARAHYTVGMQAYQEGRWADALREFRDAYKVLPRPALHNDMALCHEKLGDLDAAVRALESYLAEEQQVQDRAAIEKRIEELRARIKARPTPPAVQVKPQKKSRAWVWGVVVGGVLVVGMAVALAVGLTVGGDSPPPLLPPTRLE